MNSAFIIVGGEFDQDLTQVSLSEHDQVVDALPSDRADQPFRKAVLPWRAGRDRLVANAHGAQAAGDNRTVNGITVADQVAWCLLPGKRFGEARLRHDRSRYAGSRASACGASACT